MYFACAEKDSYAPTEMITNLDAHLNKLDINYEIDIYPNTGHGFVFLKELACTTKKLLKDIGKIT